MSLPASCIRSKNIRGVLQASSKDFSRNRLCKSGCINRKIQFLFKSNNSTNLIKKLYTAPVWGKHGILEMGKGTSIIDSLISQKYNVVLRPHPETFKHSPKKIEEIAQKYKHHEQFTLEKNITDDTSLFSSKALVTDWSGIAWEYALALKKPILFIDTPQRVNNEDYHKLPIKSF